MNSAAFEDVMTAMDFVDTIRHREKMIDTEVSSEERDRQMVDKLREFYAAQGLSVSDDTLKKGVDSLNQKRFTYAPMASGWQRSLATMYVRRVKYAKLALAGGLAIFLSVALPTAYFSHMETARIEEEQRKALAFELVIKEVLPDELKRATAAATLASSAMSDKSKDEIERRNAAALAAIEARNPDVAYEEIAKIAKIRKDLETDLLAGKLVAESAERIGEARAAAKSAAAKEAIEAAVGDVTAAARTGNEPSFWRSMVKLDAIVEEVRTPLTIKIVDRPNQKSGVWRMKNGDTRTKQFYLVVEAIKPDGSAQVRKVRNVETDRVESVSVWAINVLETVYNTYAMEKKATGLIKARAIGSKKAGSLEVDWGVQTTGAAITSW